MSGGLATRMKGSIEKPLLTVGGVPIIARVIGALEGSQSFERIVAAVSPDSPATRKFLESRGIEIIETPGKGYSLDLSQVLSKIGRGRVFVVSADMPLINAQIINEIISIKQTKPLLSVVLTKKFAKSIGTMPSVTFRERGIDYCQSGISIFQASAHSAGVMEEEYVVMDRIEVVINVNTKEELELAEKLLIQGA